jgi:HAE1 family hydrophobic/amphiphilic exporter-1
MKERLLWPRWILSSLGIFSLVFAFTAISSPVIHAQQAAPASEQAAAQQSSTADLPPLPMSPTEKAEKDGTALRLSLKDITKLALQSNLDIAIQDTNEQLNQQKIFQVYGDYDPKLTGQLGVNLRRTANTNLASQSTASYSSNDTALWNFEFSQPLKTGGTIKLGWNSQRLNSNTTFSLFNPQYQVGGTLTFTQPLWRNRNIDQTRSNIKLYNLDLKNSDSQFKQKVTETISSIQSQYWDLVAAIRNYQIKRDSVRLAQITLRDNKKKVEVGTLAPIEVTDAQANVAQREVELWSAEEIIISQENNLRALISNDRKADIWSRVIVPTDTPDFKEYTVDLETAINTALANRPELEQYDISLNQLDINTRLYENNRKWQVDLTAALGSTGNAGPQACQKNAYTGECLTDDQGNPIPATPPALVGGLGNAYKTVFTEGFYNWQVGVQLTIPLRSRSLDAQIAQQQIKKRQQLMQRRNSEQSIQVEIRNAIQKLETTRKQVETAGVSRTFSKERLDGETKRFEAGLSQNYLVLQRQNELSSAEYTELQALISYRKAIINLQKAMYTLLELNEFEIAKGSSSKVPDLK